MRQLYALALLCCACTGCPPTPPPQPPRPPLRDAASPPPAADACPISVDMGVPQPCQQGLFRLDTGMPCAKCPTSTACTWDRQVWCVPACIPGAYGCTVPQPDVP